MAGQGNPVGPSREGGRSTALRMAGKPAQTTGNTRDDLTSREYTLQPIKNDHKALHDRLPSTSSGIPSMCQSQKKEKKKKNHSKNM